MEVKRGEIYMADLTVSGGSEQGGVRPVLVIQNNTGNTYSPTVIIAPISSRMRKSRFPTHVNLHCLQRPSFVELEQIRTIDKRRLGRHGRRGRGRMRRRSWSSVSAVTAQRLPICKRR